MREFLLFSSHKKLLGPVYMTWKTLYQIQLKNLAIFLKLLSAAWLVGCQEPLVVRMASTETTTIRENRDKYTTPYLLAKVTKITLALFFL